jgi:predicted nucleic acid-binding Zn ribbon protein
MSNHNIKSLGDAITEFIHEFKLEEKIDEIKVVEDWKKIMGHNVSILTQTIVLKNGKLTVTLKSSVLRSELQMSKQKVIAMINSYFGRSVVREIIFK